MLVKNPGGHMVGKAHEIPKSARTYGNKTCPISEVRAMDHHHEGFIADFLRRGTNTVRRMIWLGACLRDSALVAFAMFSPYEPYQIKY